MPRKTKQNPAKPGHIGPNPASCDPTGGPALKPAQERALVALLEGRSVAAAARNARVGERTLRRWLAENQDFQTQLRQLREEMLSEAALRLQQGASSAVQTLFALLASKDRVETGRAALVRTALDFAFRAGAYTDLAERITALENPPPPTAEAIDLALDDDSIDDDNAAEDESFDQATE